MKIKRSVLESIIKEELAAHIRSLTEADEPDVVDAEKEDKKSKDKKNSDKNAEKKPAKEPVKNQAKDLKVDDDEADKPLEKDVADPEADAESEDAEDVTGGKIADEITGKTIQSVTMEPKSKTLPGAIEVNFTFKEIQDPLKILVTKSGQVKFYFKGLHNKM